jgi:ribonuclease D
VEQTKGLSRSLASRQAQVIVDAIARGQAIPEAELPKFPRSPRFARDPDYEERVLALKSVRDRRAAELELDPGVLCPRERLEAVARKNPRASDDLAEIPELRKWQAEVLGEDFIRALHNGTPGDSPYREG